VEADAGPAYAGASLRRKEIMTPRYILEITSAKSADDAEHTFDWVYHNFGQQELSLAMQPYFGFARHDGYQHLTGNQASEPAADWQDTFRISAGDGLVDRGMHLWMLPDTHSDGMPGLKTKVVSGFGLGPDLKVPVPYVLLRRRGRSAQFVALMEPFSKQPVVRAFKRDPRNSPSTCKYTIEGQGWKDIVTIGDRITVERKEG